VGGVAAAHPPMKLEHPSLLPSLLLGRAPGTDEAFPRRTKRDWVVDSAMIALSVLVGLLGLEWGAPLWWLNLAGGLVAAQLVWVRRRRPVGVCVALSLLGSVATIPGIATLPALFTVAVHRPARVAWAMAALGLVAAAVYSVVYPEPDLPFLIVMGISVLCELVAVGWGMLVRSRRQLVLSLHERIDRAEAEHALGLERARHAERERIAREMHDVLAHRLSLVSLHAGALEFGPDAPAEEVAQAAGVIRANAHQALEELRQVIGSLRRAPAGATPEPPQPRLADLPALVEESRAAGMRVTAAFRPEALETVPGTIGRHAYRVVQEGLTNARKHAPRCHVRLSVEAREGDALSVELRNPLPIGVPAGPGIPGAAAGLTGLAERVSLAGGELEHGRTPEGEYRLAARLPWPA
jgi:signal transduction histidine kinase